MAVVAIRPSAAVLEALPPADGPLARLTEAKRAAALDLEALLRPAIQKINEGVSTKAAAQWLAAQADGLPSWKTIERHLTAYRQGGVAALVDQRTGKQRKDYGWELRAQALYANPSQRARTTVAILLRREGHESATNSRVEAYLKSLPANVSTHSPQRLGPNFHRNNVKPYKRLDYSNIKFGEVWTSDGHKLKVSSRAPGTDNVHRMELIAVLDVKSNYCLGVWWARAESSLDSIYAYCSVANRWGKTPVIFRSDHGPGYDNHAINALFKFTGTTPVRSLPGLARARGVGEQFWGRVTETFSRNYDSFCGDDRTDDVIARLATKWKRREIYIPTDEEVMADFAGWIDWYNAEPQMQSGKLQGAAPRDLLHELVQDEVRVPVELMLRPEITPSVRQSTIRLENRWYTAAFLRMYDGQVVRAKFDPHNEDVVWIFDAPGRYLGTAELVRKQDGIADSIYADAQERKRLAAIKIKQAAIDRINDEYRAPISTSDFVESIATPELPAPPSAGRQMLEQGHSLSVPAPRPRALPRPAKTLDHEAHAATVAALAADAVPMETAQQRFARCQALCAARAAGEPISEPDASWLAIYETTPECSAFRMVFDDLGG